MPVERERETASGFCIEKYTDYEDRLKLWSEQWYFHGGDDGTPVLVIIDTLSQAIGSSSINDDVAIQSYQCL